MTEVLGLELSNALDLLKSEGYSVRCVGYASRKGVKGNEKRVIRQKIVDDDLKTVEVVYSIFKTDVDYIED